MKRRYWNSSEKEFLKMEYSNTSTKKIALELNRTKKAVKSMVGKMGLKKSESFIHANLIKASHIAGNKRINVIVKHCKFCESPFYVSECYQKQNYCSRMCFNKDRTQKILPYSLKDFEYLIGVLHGNGYLRKNIGEFSTMCAEEDYAKELVRTWKNTFGTDIPIYTNVRKDTKGVVVSVQKQKYLQNFVGFKTDGYWKIPKLIYPKDYIAALYDTDGTVGFKKYKSREGIGFSPFVSISQCKKENLDLIVPILAKLGFNKPHVLTIKSKYPIKSKYAGNLYLVYAISFQSWFNVKLFYDTIPLRHNNKQSRLSALVKVHNEFGYVTKEKFENEFYNENGIVK